MASYTGESEDSGIEVSYRYDRFGNRSSMTVVEKGSSKTTEYSYDSNNRLLEETSNLPWGASKEYKYDPNGNTLSKTVDVLTSTNSNSNQPGEIYLSLTPPTESLTSVSAAGIIDMSELYEYNALNQLEKVGTRSDNVTYEYRPDGLRHSKKSVSGKTIHA